MLRATALCAAAAAPAAGDLSFLVMGDWGGSGSSPYTTAAEIATAAGMGKVAGQMSPAPKFALAVGDNFYSKGIGSDCHDARFKHTFEDVFTATELQGPDFKFHVIAGNHDHNGNVSAQIAYTGLSNRWNYPDSWFTFTKDVGGGKSLQVVMIDTVVLSGNSDVLNASGELVHELRGSELPGPVDEALAQTQMQWVEATLKSSTADYLIVAGHYPVYSICEHGPTSNLVKNLKPLLEQYKVSAYIAGHDHCEEYINEGTGVDYHGMGSAHSNDKSTAHSGNIPKGSLKYHNAGSKGGFGSFSITSAGMVARHHEGDGSVLYTAPTKAPRGSDPGPTAPPAPAPAPATPSPPVPPPAGQTWKCYNGKTVKIGTDDDLKDVGKSIDDCKARCQAANGCLAIQWHISDTHCHTLSGSFSQDDFTAALKSDDDHDACILIAKQ